MNCEKYIENVEHKRENGEAVKQTLDFVKKSLSKINFKKIEFDEKHKFYSAETAIDKTRIDVHVSLIEEEKTVEFLSPLPESTKNCNPDKLLGVLNYLNSGLCEGMFFLDKAQQFVVFRNARSYLHVKESEEICYFIAVNTMYVVCYSDLICDFICGELTEEQVYNILKSEYSDEESPFSDF